MSQINVNNGGAPVDTEERAASAGFGIVAVLLAIAVAVVVVWLLFSGLFSGAGSSANTSSPPAQTQPANRDNPTVNINVPKVDVNTSGSGQTQPAQPAQPAAPAKP